MIKPPAKCSHSSHLILADQWQAQQNHDRPAGSGDIANGALDLNTIVTVYSYSGTMGDQGMGKRSEGSIMGDLGDFANDPGQDMSAGLSPGDTVSIQDLLYGLLLDSGNDAALAVAEAVSGTITEGLK